MKLNSLLEKEKDIVLNSYVMAGDPDLETSYKIIESLIESGSKIIELGMPFSDPVADGEVIQRAALRSLKNDVSIDDCFALVARVNEKYPSVPIILMGYLNPIFFYGVKEFADKAKEIGVAGLIIVDLPYEEQINFAELNSEALPLIPLITPLTTGERLDNILKEAYSFLYYISVFGTTGTQKPDLEAAIKEVGKLREKSGNKKIAIGFGIKEKEQIDFLRGKVDICIIGSAYCRIIEENMAAGGEKIYKELRIFNKSLF